MEVEASFPAGGEALELVERGEGPLDDVAELAEAADVGLASTEDDRQDPTPGQLASDVPTVVSLITGKGLGPLAWPTRSASRGRDAVDQGECLGDVGALPPVVITFSGVPLPSRIRWCSLPDLPRSTGDGSTPAPPLPSSWPRNEAPGLRPWYDLSPQSR